MAKWLVVAAMAPGLCGQSAPKTILAIGAHAGDMEISAGALLAQQAKRGDRVVVLHLTLGEGGNRRMSPEAYGEQKRREALVVAKALGVEARFGPYLDGQVPLGDEAATYIAGVIREVRPSVVVTHWRRSMHKDHERTCQLVKDAVLLASLEAVKAGGKAHSVGQVLYAENWEDAEEFRPYLYFDVSESFEAWKKAVAEYEFIRGGISRFPYLDYYAALARVRGAEAGTMQAIGMEVDEGAKKRVLKGLP